MTCLLLLRLLLLHLLLLFQPASRAAPAVNTMC
jgi:hypothetical protein